MFLHQNIYEHNVSKNNYLEVDEHIVITFKTTPPKKMLF